MADLNIWIREAAQHGMKYGDYVAAVKDGRLPRPDIPVRATAPSRRAIKCRYCQCMFEPKHGSQRYCSDMCHEKMKKERYRIKSDRWPVVSPNKKT